MTRDLASVVVGLEPVDGLAWNGPRPPFLGRAAHALLLAQIAEVDPSLAEAQHTGDGPRPFTTGVLLRLATGEPPVVRLRWSTLTAPISAVLLERIVGALPDEVRLDEATLRVAGVATMAEADPDAGAGSYRAIVERWLLGGAVPVQRFRFHFLSPTTFRSSGRNLPLPLPGMVFGSLIDRWNAFSPLTLNPDARRFAEECLALARYRLETRMVDVAGGRQTGFVGWVDFVALQHDPYWLRVLNALADYAFYAGVGAKTTMGLGQTRRVDPLPRRAREMDGGDEGGRGSREAGREAAPEQGMASTPSQRQNPRGGD